MGDFHKEKRSLGVLVSCPDPTHSNEEKGLVLFEQFLGFADLA